MTGKALRLACVFLASGRSRRFGGNKLLSDFGGRPMIDAVLGGFPAEQFNQIAVVTRYAAVAVTAAGLGFAVVENSDETGDIARTIRLGLEALAPDIDGCMFSVCDQPLLRARSVERLAAAFRAAPDKIAALGCGGKRGNPVVFPRALFGELSALAPGRGGGAVIDAHRDLLRVVEAEDRLELLDVDFQCDLDGLRKLEKN